MKINTKHPKLMVNSNFYSKTTTNTIKEEDSITISVPYILTEHTEETLSEYNKFMKEYDEKHKFCPKCGAEEHISTMMGYILDKNKKSEYVDKNICECTNCGDKHITHDRV